MNGWLFSKHLVNNTPVSVEVYMRTLARVSGSRSPTSPPPTNTDDAIRMGIALVMPTNEPKIRLPITAASLHMALQKPKPVPLKTRKTQRTESEPEVVARLHRPSAWCVRILTCSGVFSQCGMQYCYIRVHCVILSTPCMHSPPVCWVELRGDHIQGVPGGDTEAVVEAEHEDHHGLAGAEPKEEAADA